MKEWQSPSFVDLRMDAEIGSYQDDSDRDREAPLFAGLAVPAAEGEAVAR